MARAFVCYLIVVYVPIPWSWALKLLPDAGVWAFRGEGVGQ
jgi:hypothetical protein